MIAESSRGVRAPLLVAAVLVGTSSHVLVAKDKPQPAAEYFGHAQHISMSRCVIHIEAFTPEVDAQRVARAGHDGNASLIRDALGRLDFGYVKLGQEAYRIAYARRLPGDGGSRIILLFRNEMSIGGQGNLREQINPPLAAADIWIPEQGDGSVVFSGSAVVTFRSVDDIGITDLGMITINVADLRATAH